ncbi:MAG: hypothetical protein EKK46_02975 [Rhodocyclaceae bacterium]|nr:MAG: hypothetical protein EKK46_02975 [Rhodocyclaceae bacterium]
MNAHLTTEKLNELSRGLAELCVKSPVAAGCGALARSAGDLASGLSFRDVLARGGWYRLGGVVNAQGDRIAEDLEAWAEAELANHNDDFGALHDHYADAGLSSTHLTGKTHYLVATTGDAPTDFIQVEVEELQEVISHPLFTDDNPPASLDELVDPRSGDNGASTPLGIPFYALRRVTDITDFVGRMGEQKPDPQPVHRFIDAWEKSSAGRAAVFCNHWVLAVREHLDRYHQTILQATPAAALNGAPPRFELTYGTQGLALAEALQRFDKQIGYPMAWFFHMLTTKAVPHAVAVAVIDDMQAGFSYLPERDIAVIKDWLYSPYGF